MVLFSVDSSRHVCLQINTRRPLQLRFAESRIVSQRCHTPTLRSTEKARRLVRMVSRRVWQGTKKGNISALRLVERDLADPQPGECRVEVKAIGLNFVDVFTALGLIPSSGERGYVPGFEFSGVVEEVGKSADDSPGRSSVDDKGASTIEPGTKVFGVTLHGAYATHLNVPLELVRPLPGNWTFSQGAAFFFQGVTSWYALRILGNVGPGKTVLIHSAAGGCGMFATKICQKLGAGVVATVGGGSKAEFLVSQFPGYLTSDSIIIRDKSIFPQQLDHALSSLGAASFDTVLDPLVGGLFHPAYERVSPGGRYIVFGGASLMNKGDRPNFLKLLWGYLTRPKLDLLTLPAANRGVMALNVLWIMENHQLLNELLDQLVALELTPPHIGETFDFDDAPDALRKLQSGETVGKVVLEL